VEIKLAKPQELGALKQRLFRLLWATITLEQSTIKILERTSLYVALPEPADVADLTDRIHEAFNAFAQLRKTSIWLDVDDDLE